MAKKSGWVGSKALTRTEVMSGSKAMPKNHMPMTQGKMATYRELNTGDKSHDMINASGRIGADKRTFSSGIPSEAPCNYKKHG